MVEIAGDEAETDSVTTPAGIDTDSAWAMVAPEQTGPTMPTTRSTLISLVTASTAAVGSQALSARTTSSAWPSANIPPWSLMCLAARSTAATMGLTRSGIGPVTAIGLPTLTCACALAASAATAVASRSFRMDFSLLVPLKFPCRARRGASPAESRLDSVAISPATAIRSTASAGTRPGFAECQCRSPRRCHRSGQSSN